MNLVECYITEIIGETYQEYGYWFLKVKFDSYGVIGEKSLIHKDKLFLESLKVGDEFFS